MIYEAVIPCDNMWSEALQDMITVNFHFTIFVEDASFDHDWHPGAVEKCISVHIEEVHIGFQWKGKPVMFDLGSGKYCMLDIDEDIRAYFPHVEEKACTEAVESFCNPEEYPFYAGY